MGKKGINWCESDRGLGKVKSKEKRKKKVWGESFITVTALSHSFMFSSLNPHADQPIGKIDQATKHPS